MRCKESRELILTDRMDGRLSEEQQNALEKHLSSCTACNELQAEAIKNLSGVFEMGKKNAPPVYVWERIKGQIESQTSREGVFSGVLDILRNLASAVLRIPRPVMAFAATAIIIIGIMATIPVIRGRAIDIYLGEQMDFVARLDASQANGEDFFDTDIRTGVENFL